MPVETSIRLFTISGRLSDQRHSDASSHRDAEDVCLVDAQRVQQSGCIVCHHLDGIRHVRFIAASRATVVERDDLVAF